MHNLDDLYLDELRQEFVSTGSLPPVDQRRNGVQAAYELFRDNTEGACSTVYPALEEADPDLFGISIVSTKGIETSVGDYDNHFPIMSVVKPFVFALVADHFGPTEMHDRIGVNATGYPFNSVTAIERSPDGRTNPMVNSGAIATTSMALGETKEDKWQFLVDGLSRLAGRPLTVMDDVYASASTTNYRNRSIVDALEERGRVYCDAADALDLYTRACSLAVTARDLAIMGATLADGGVNPVTHEKVVEAETCHFSLVVMVTAGMYETSGDWLYLTGLPGKSGIGGGIVSIAPGKGGMGTYAPRLDSYGNSVKGQLVAAYLARELGINLFASVSAE